MTTYPYEYTKKVYTGLPFTVKIRKDHYWDSTETHIYDGTPILVQMWAYTPLTISSFQESTSLMAVSIASGQLPNNSTCANTLGCLATAGQSYPIYKSEYINYTTYGTPTINVTTGVVSDFSSSNYLTLPSTTTSNYFDLIQKVMYNGVSGEQTIWWTPADKGIAIYSNKLGIFSGGWVLGSTTFTEGTYWIRAIYDNGTLSLYSLADNDYTLDTLPAISDWTAETTLSASNIFSGYTIYLSRNNDSYRWQGSMDLSGSAVYADTSGTPWWVALGTTTLSAVGLLPSGVVDDGTEKTWNLFYNYSTETFLLDTTATKSGYAWVGDITIPAHTV